MELLVVLTIIGLIAAIVASNVLAALRGEPSAAERLASINRSARSASLQLGKTTCLEVNAARGTFRISARIGYADSLLVAGALPGLMRMRPVQDGNQSGTVCFYPSGLPSDGVRWSVIAGEITTVEVDRWDGRVSIFR